MVIETMARNPILLFALLIAVVIYLFFFVWAIIKSVNRRDLGWLLAILFLNQLTLGFLAGYYVLKKR